MTIYVMADVHGLKDKYEEMMKVIKDEDTLYILGDVIDRGPNGISILLDIMQRKNVKMLMGNHERMMIDYYRAENDPDMELNLKYFYMDCWCMNGNVPTMREYNELSEEQKGEVLHYLNQLPYAFTNIEVNGRKFFLTHGKYVEGCLDELVIDEHYIQEKGLKKEDFIWGRVDIFDELKDDRIAIVGHTPTVVLKEHAPYEIWFNKETIETSNIIDIDCGCAARNEHSRLALLCLDDLSVQYF